MRRPYIGTYPITRPFGVYDKAYANYPGSKHPGTDYGVPVNTNLVASISGKATVYARGNTATGRGNEVVITNGSTQVKYCHLNSIAVANGANVVEGQIVGKCGWTGYVLPKSPDGAHLHFEVLIKGVYTNPEIWLKGATVNNTKPAGHTRANQIAHAVLMRGMSKEEFNKYHAKKTELQLFEDFRKSKEHADKEAQLKNPSEANILGTALIKLLNSLGWKKG